MSRQFIRHICIFAILALLGTGPGPFPASAAQEEISDVEKGMDVLTYGPIHEAFAETVAFDPEPGIIVSKAPPDLIDEIPPEQKPEGDVEWIPGYWAWDDDRNDFIWLSGIWRVIPPDRQWIPGYWVRSEVGFQWISGYWAPQNESVTAYLPEPPESVEVGPNVSSPSRDYGWIPGCWVWVNGRYAWRPGYWSVMRPDWVWVPAHYLWTPRGYIFVGGYWDVAIARRGVLFAPVSFGIGVTLTHGFYFTPSFMIDLRVFSDCLFLRPRYHHYYFGDYYAAGYYQKGIFPWFSPHVRRHGYDPIYAHQRWQHRRDRNWGKNLRATYQERRRYKEARPPRTLYHWKKPHPKAEASKASGRPFKEPFLPVTKSGEGISKFKPFSRNERAQIEQRAKQVRTLSSQRLKWESQGVIKPSVAPKRIEANKMKPPKSPIAAKSSGPIPTKKAPANRYKVSQPNPPGEPLQKRSSVVPGTSKRMKTDGILLPRSPSGAKQAGPSKPNIQAPTRKAPPDRHSAPQPNPTVEPLQRRLPMPGSGIPRKP
ncbi:MAG: hypothetical protein GY846_01635 [Deltaproteobacteria bacterium]|nr:hypothetical protein [Deltaproteobacteria bacterium]